MIRIVISLLKDELLLEKQRTVFAKTLINRGEKPQMAYAEAKKCVSDVQCTYNVTSDSKEVNPHDIINDVVQRRPYRVVVSYV